MKCVPVHHGIPAVLHRDEPWLHRHSENGALSLLYLLLCLDLYVLGDDKLGVFHANQTSMSLDSHLN